MSFGKRNKEYALIDLRWTVSKAFDSGATDTEVNKVIELELVCRRILAGEDLTPSEEQVFENYLQKICHASEVLSNASLSWKLLSMAHILFLEIPVRLIVMGFVVLTGECTVREAFHYFVKENRSSLKVYL
jgi:hypothetical protein